MTAMWDGDLSGMDHPRFDAFRRHYNEEPWYNADHEVRRVRPPGTIKWRDEPVFIGAALAGEQVGIAELESAGHIVRSCDRDLGRDRKRNSVRDVAGPKCQG